MSPLRTLAASTAAFALLASPLNATAAPTEHSPTASVTDDVVVFQARTALAAPVTRAALAAPVTRNGTKYTRITARVSTRYVVVNKGVWLKGKVSTKKGTQRPVVLQVKSHRGWRAVKRSRANRQGYYTVKVTTSWYGTHQFRALAPATSSHRRAASDARMVKVRPDYSPRGAASSSSLLHPSARWNPCQVVRYKTNLNGAAPGALRDIRGAFARIHATTGLRFKRVGSTSKVPFTGKNAQRGFEWNTIVVAYATPQRVPRLAGGVAGIGGAGLQSTRKNGRTVTRYVYGGVVVDSTQGLPAGFDPGVSNGLVLMHEIAHVLGAGHVGDPSQVMNSYLDAGSIARFGYGDLATLRALGASKGCL